jgi:hypothetical protein
MMQNKRDDFSHGIILSIHFRLVACITDALSEILQRPGGYISDRRFLPFSPVVLRLPKGARENVD